MEHRSRAPEGEKGKPENLFLIRHKSIGAGRLRSPDARKSKRAPERNRGFAGSIRHGQRPDYDLKSSVSTAVSASAVGFDDATLEAANAPSAHPNVERRRPGIKIAVSRRRSTACTSFPRNAICQSHLYGPAMERMQGIPRRSAIQQRVVGSISHGRPYSDATSRYGALSFGIAHHHMRVVRRRARECGRRHIMQPRVLAVPRGLPDRSTV